MHEVLGRLRASTQYPLHARIGLAIGDVAAGVMGRLQPRFHLIGPALQSAEAHEKMAPQDSILLSEPFFLLMRGFGGVDAVDEATDQSDDDISYASIDFSCPPGTHDSMGLASSEAEDLCVAIAKRRGSSHLQKVYTRFLTDSHTGSVPSDLDPISHDPTLAPLSSVTSHSPSHATSCTLAATSHDAHASLQVDSEISGHTCTSSFSHRARPWAEDPLIALPMGEAQQGGWASEKVGRDEDIPGEGEEGEREDLWIGRGHPQLLSQVLSDSDISQASSSHSRPSGLRRKDVTQGFRTSSFRSIDDDEQDDVKDIKTVHDEFSTQTLHPTRHQLPHHLPYRHLWGWGVEEARCNAGLVAGSTSDFNVSGSSSTLNGGVMERDTALSLMERESAVSDSGVMQQDAALSCLLPHQRGTAAQRDVTGDRGEAEEEDAGGGEEGGEVGESREAVQDKGACPSELLSVRPCPMQNTSHDAVSCTSGLVHGIEILLLTWILGEADVPPVASLLALACSRRITTWHT